jgi:hypothetical protein
MAEKSSRVQIIVSVLALVGVLGAALLSNWDKLFESSNNGKSIIPDQSSVGTASPNIGSITGDVNISVNEPPSTLRIPDFSGEDLSIKKIDQLENFIQENRGKLVHINVTISEKQSRILEEDQKYLSLASIQCDTPSFSDCATLHLILLGSDFDLGWYKGNNILSGYFVVGETVEYHVGPYFDLKGVSREEVLLRTPRGSAK